MSDTSQPDVDVSAAVEDVRIKILHNLEVYPYLSRAMIQTGLGPAMPPRLWDPVLEDLIIRGEIMVVEKTVTSPGGRALTKQIYHLPTYPYPPVGLAELHGIDAIHATIDQAPNHPEFRTSGTSTDEQSN